MRALIALPILALSLAACGDLTQEEACNRAALALALVEANVAPDSQTAEAARANYRAICGLPVERPE